MAIGNDMLSDRENKRVTFLDENLYPTCGSSRIETQDLLVNQSVMGLNLG